MSFHWKSEETRDVELNKENNDDVTECWKNARKSAGIWGLPDPQGKGLSGGGILKVF